MAERAATKGGAEHDMSILPMPALEVAAGAVSGVPSAWTVPLFIPSLPAFDVYQQRLQQVSASGTFTNFGPMLRAFEMALAEGLGVSPTRVVGVSSATAGLTCALLAVAERGGHCIMPAWTHSATPSAARRAGLEPWFLDVDLETWQLDPTDVEERISLSEAARVAAVVLVSPFGARIDVPEWEAFADRTGVPVLVDAAAGFDTWQDSRLTSVVSFHATKGFGIGEGGAVLAPDDSTGLRIRMATSLGMDSNRVAVVDGMNAKLDEFRSAIGLAALDTWQDVRAAILERSRAYFVALHRSGLSFRRPYGLEDVANSTYPIALSGPHAVDMIEALAQRGVHARRWWGDGCHRVPVFVSCPCEGVPVTDALAARVIGLPLYATVPLAAIEYVVSCLEEIGREYEHR
ncbi:degT/dnrJ/eryC1/strS family protein [alpha proteobacterium BAL199]|nr:degT/dnrJ/eryC1/strS family protein [alpha proteobacterium BAL199]